MATIKVKAAPGIARFPMVGQATAKKYITNEPVPVESSAYYRRAIADGDLVLVTETAPAASVTGKRQNGGQEAAKAVAPAQDKQDKKAATDE